MSKLIDYKCSEYLSSNYLKEAAEKLNYNFPDLHKSSRAMSEISLEIMKEQGSAVAILPYCHTVEAENVGALINLGDENFGPRVERYRYESLNELSDIPKFDFEKGRLKNILSAIKLLSTDKQKIMLEIAGPITFFSSLCDIKHILKGIRKDPEKVKSLLKYYKNQLISYIDMAEKSGVTIISYADSSAGLGIVGPAVSKFLSEEFTLPFLKEYQNKFKSLTIHLCPKTTYVLSGLELAYFNEVCCDDLTYMEIITSDELRGHILGDRCINFMNDKIKNKKIRELILK